MAKRVTNLERKIRWYFKNVNESIDCVDLDIILMSRFNEEGKLTLVDPDEVRARYIKYWKKIAGSGNQVPKNAVEKKDSE